MDRCAEHLGDLHPRAADDGNNIFGPSAPTSLASPSLRVAPGWARRRLGAVRWERRASNWFYDR